MRVIICAIAKNENDYINEWVNHYVKLGFDHIYLFDNNEIDTERVENFIDKDLLKQVSIIDYRGVKRHHLQHYVYDWFYKHYKTTFDWLMFVDIDEFLVGIDNIKEFLTNPKFKNYQQIRIKWQLFGDDNIVERDIKQPVLGYFKKVITDYRKSNQTKSLIRGNLPILKINSCHYVKGLKSCYPSGKECLENQISLEHYDGETIFVNHYMTKTRIVDRNLCSVLF